MLELLAQPDAMSRDLFEPGHFTVGAFAVHGDSVMMVHHRRLGIWLEPGGHIDDGDMTLEAAAARELFEETGIVAGQVRAGLFDVDVHDIPAGKGEPPHKHFNVSYHFAAASADVVVAAEVAAARWVRFGEVAQLTLDPAVRRAAAKLEEIYRR